MKPKLLIILAIAALCAIIYITTRPTLPDWLTGQRYTPQGKDDLIYLNNAG